MGYSFNPKKFVTAPLDAAKQLASGNVSGAAKAGEGATVGGSIPQTLGDAGKYTGTLGSKISSGWKNTQGKKHDSHSAENDAAQMQANEDTQYAQNQDYSKQIGANDQAYLGTMQGNVNKYQGDLDILSNEAELSRKDSQKTYSNDIQPRMKDLMETAQNNASSAMSLKDSMDPNNSVATSTRKLYSDQAQNEGKAGLAGAATLQALGAQNFGTQLGGAGPMTGGQMAALMGQNQAASSAAYGNTQKRMQDLQDQGLTQGFARSDLAYNNGQKAQQAYGQSVNNYQNSDAQNQQQQTGYRNEIGGYSGQGYGLQQQMADTTRGVNDAGVQRDMAIYNTHMGGNQANIASQIQGINAQQAQQAGYITSGAQTAGTVFGSIYGGPAGGVAGGAAGKAAGNAAAPDPYNTPSYGNYGYGSASNPNPTMQQQQMGIGAYQNGDNSQGNGAQSIAGFGLADNSQRPSMAQAMTKTRFGSFNPDDASSVQQKRTSRNTNPAAGAYYSGIGAGF